MSDKITSEDCKRAIIGYVQAHGEKISSEFYPALTSKQRRRRHEREELEASIQDVGCSE